MKDKIVAKIKAKHPTLVIAKKILDAAAAKVEAKCGGDETLIDANLEAYEDFNPIPDQVKAFDRLATAEAKAKANSTSKDKDPEKETTDPETAADPAKPKPDDTAALLKQVLAEVAGLKAEKQTNQIVSQVTAKMKEKNIPEIIWGKRVLPKTAEEIEAFVTEVDTEYAAFNQSLTDRGLLNAGGVRKATGVPAGDKPVDKDDPVVKEVMKQIT